MKFEYKIEDSSEDMDLISEGFTSARDPLPTEKIEFKIDKNSNSVSIIGNREGWEYLAKLCVEMSFCFDKDKYFHLHRMSSLADSLDDSKTVVSFLIKN